MNTIISPYPYHAAPAAFYLCDTPGPPCLCVETSSPPLPTQGPGLPCYVQEENALEIRLATDCTDYTERWLVFRSFVRIRRQYSRLGPKFMMSATSSFEARR